MLQLIRAHESFASTKKSPAQKKNTNAAPKASPAKSPSVKAAEKKKERPPEYKGDPQHKDNSFREFRRLVANIAETSSYLNKTELVRNFFAKGSDKTKFQGDLYVWVRLLLPGRAGTRTHLPQLWSSVSALPSLKLFSQLPPSAGDLSGT